jgi:hypothetical protein
LQDHDEPGLCADVEAAWAAGHDATPTVQASGYDVAMGVARRRSMLLALVVLVAACQFGTGLPASFEEHLKSGSEVFTPTTPTAGIQPSTKVVADLGGWDLRVNPDFAVEKMPFFNGPAVPILGLLRCVAPGCQPVPDLPVERPVWLVVYPDWTDAGGDVGWVIVDARTGLESGYMFAHDPRDD